MRTPTNAKVKYVKEGHYFIANFSGKINKRKLAYRRKTLRNCIMRNIKDSKVIKVLLDIRSIQFDSEETHDIMRRMSAKHSTESEFHGYTVFTAVLNDHYEGKVLGNKSYFTNEQDALDWLGSK